MITLKANSWQQYISTMASAEEMRTSYNARMSCVNTGIFKLNSSKSWRGCFVVWGVFLLLLSGFFSFFPWLSLL